MPRRIAPALLLIPVALAGCSLLGGEAAVHEPPLPHRLPERIETVVLEPFGQAEGAGMNPADLDFWRGEVERALGQRPRLQAAGEAPTSLPSVARLEATVTTFAVDEAEAGGLFLRTVDAGAELRVSFPNADTPPRTLQRRLSYQKIYGGQETVPARTFDVQSALIELADQVAQALRPADWRPLELATATDPDTGAELAVPVLRRANRFASQGLIRRAQSLWEVVLFRPGAAGAPPEDERYRVNRRTLNQLRIGEAPKSLLDQLEDWVDTEPTAFVRLRSELRDDVEGLGGYEERVLELADLQGYRTHLNLAAAHYNLGVVYRAQHRYDLAAHHLAMAYAHNPAPAVLEAWGVLQATRRLIAGDQQAFQQAVRRHLRLPPPHTASVLPGSVAAAVLPGSALRERLLQRRLAAIAGRTVEPMEVELPDAGGQAEPGPAAPGPGAGGAEATPDAGETQPVELQPVEVQPVEVAPGGGASGGEAADSGQGGPEGVPIEAPESAQ